MNSKSFLLFTALCASASLPTALAQGGGGSGGGSGGASGAAGAGASSGAASAGASSAAAGSGTSTSTGATTGQASGANAGSSSAPAGAPTTGSGTSSATTTGASSGITVAPATPNTSTSMPIRSVLGTESQSNPNAPASTPGSLPPGITTNPARPGVSPLSGVPLSEIPPVSRGTAPLGPNVTVPPIQEPPRDPRAAGAATGITDPSAIAAHPLTNPQIGQGTTMVVPTPPPIAPRETAPSTISNDGNVWVAGHYSWTGGQWTWVNGNWQRPPRENASWVPGAYDAQNKRWTEGHWDTSGAATRK